MCLLVSTKEGVFGSVASTKFLILLGKNEKSESQAEVHNNFEMAEKNTASMGIGSYLVAFRTDFGMIVMNLGLPK